MRSVVFSVALVLLLTAGCRTPESNPPAPQANTGYVDFYTDSDLGLAWEVKRSGPDNTKWQTVYSKYTPLEGNILRLATSPGTHQFQVWFSNRVTTGPEDVIVEVLDGKVTPVHVTLTSAGKASVDRKSHEYRPTPQASRRVTRTTAEDQQVYQTAFAPAAPQAYQPKERMPYSSRAVK